MLWDSEFVNAVIFAQTSVSRQKARVTQHIEVKGMQTLLVPQKPPGQLDTSASGLGWPESFITEYTIYLIMYFNV